MKCQKDKFQIDKNIHYLNCAYKAPLLKKGEKAILNAILKERNPYLYKPKDFFESSELARVLFAEMINAKSSQIALFPSTSYGFATALHNVKARNKKAVTIENEFPSGYFALDKWSVEHQASLITVKKGARTAKLWNEAILNSIDKKTDVVLMSMNHWMDGTKIDIKSIGDKCHQLGVTFIVDATQLAGAFPIDVVDLKIDALICAGYKWLFGPYSMAIGYFSPKFSDGIPIEESWMNRTNAMEFSKITEYDTTYKPDSSRYNVGQTSNFLLTPILIEGLKQIQKWGVLQIHNYCFSLFSEIKNELSPIGVGFEENDYIYPHLFSLKLPNRVSPEAMKTNLEKNKIYVSLRGSYIRVSLNVFNNKNDIDALKNCIQKKLR
tara:strand:+ start:1171 stop:2310 length:1140 start_codon:yes stop_codon:yes gene_type:complete